MSEPFFSRRFTLPGLPAWMDLNVALVVLMVVFFLIPFSFRGARMAMEGMKNDIKDWLPSDFKETADLDWFREHFLGERFVVVTWPGMTGRIEDEKYRLFIDKLMPEVPPSKRAQVRAEDSDLLKADEEFLNPELGYYIRELRPGDLDWRDGFVGDRLGLFVRYDDQGQADFNTNWGGRQEKWLLGRDGKQYYYLPVERSPDQIAADPEAEPEYALYEWTGQDTVIGAASRWIEKRTTGKNELSGELVTTFRGRDAEWYYDDPRRLAAYPFKTIISGPTVLNRLAGDGGELSGEVEQAIERLEGPLFGPTPLVPQEEWDPANGPRPRQTAIVATLSEPAQKDLRMVVGRPLMGKQQGTMLRVAEEVGLEPEELHLGGPSVDNVAIDEEGQITLMRLIWLCAAVGVGLSYLLFRDFRLTIMVFMVGGIAAVTSLSLVWWGGSSVDAVLMTMPSLVYVLGLSGAIHIVNYYADARREEGPVGAPERALSHGWWPCTLAAITTALGLLSLCNSNIVPISKFGLFSAIGVVATLSLLFTYLPAALTLWPPDRSAILEDESTWWGDLISRFNAWTEQFSEQVARGITRFSIPVAVTCGIVMVSLGAWGLPRINTSIQLLKLFDGDAKIIRDYGWLEQNMGKLVPMEVVLRFDPQWLATMGDDEDQERSSSKIPKPIRYTMLQRIEAADAIGDIVAVEYGEHEIEPEDASDDGEPKIVDGIVGKAISASTFMRDLPGPAARERGIYSRRLEAHREEIVRSDYLREDMEDGADLWRISYRLGALSNVDYGDFVNALQSAIEPALTAYRTRDKLLREVAASENQGGRVFLLGRSFGAKTEPTSHRLHQEAAEAEEMGVAKSETTEPVLPLRQTFIFTQRLFSLLRNEDLKPVVAQQLTPETVRGLPVVLIETPAAAPEQLAALQAAASVWIDAREHHFLPGQSPTARDLPAPEQGALTAVYTGAVPIVYKAQRTLLDSLIESIFLAFVTILFVMILLLAPGRDLIEKLYPSNLGLGIGAALVSMIPNVFPLVMIFGAMGTLGIAVDIGSMMTASVAMGIAVDDTIHFLTWFRDGLSRGLSREDSIKLAYDRCAAAMFQTTVIGGLGLAVFALSTFTPTQRFGVLMVSLLATALVGDLLFLPAILASPLGWFFRAAAEKHQELANESEPSPNSEAAAVESPVNASSSEALSNGSPHPSDHDLHESHSENGEANRPHTRNLRGASREAS